MVAPLLALWTHRASAHASVALLMEEPFGKFGAMNPTGHAAVYLNHVCAESPTELRMCEPGEYGVVISRYHKIHKYDWICDTTDSVPLCSGGCDRYPRYCG